MIALDSCSKKDTAPVDSSHFRATDTMMARTVLDTVKVTQVEGSLTLNGRITADESKLVDVFPVMAGNVLAVNAELGDYVQKGATLALIRSPEAAGLQRELNDAEGDLLVAQKNLKVQEDLFASKLSSERDVLSARKEVQQAESNLKRLHELYTINNVGTHSEYTVKAPISGYVVYKAINRDMSIPAGKTDKIFTVAQLDDIWVMANVYESDIARVQEGMDATISTLSYKDKEFKGKVDKIFNVLDPQTKTMKVRIKLDNTGLLLKPEMFAMVRLNYKEPESLPSVPSSSIVFDKSRHFVMVFHSRDSLETREVEIHRAGDDRTWISKGLNSGEVVVSHNQLYFYDALND